MHPFILATALACLTGYASHARATATVTFAPAASMSDVPRFGADLAAMEMQLREHLDELSASLPAGQTLTVEFLDIDLAGDVFPRVPIRDVRVLKGTGDGPRLHFRYRIEENGKVVRSGEQQLHNPSYLTGANRYPQDMYGHEKQMLELWFRKEGVVGR